MSEKSFSLRERIREELKNFLIVFIYTWLVLSLFSLHKAFVLGRNPLSGQLFAVINAIVLGKVVVIFEFFRVGKIVYEQMAVVRVFVKSVMYGLLLFLFHIVEEGIIGWFHGRPFTQTLTEIDNGRLMELGTLAVLTVVVFVPYFLLREIVAAIGGKKLVAILFSKSPAATAPEP